MCVALRVTHRAPSHYYNRSTWDISSYNQVMSQLTTVFTATVSLRETQTDKQTDTHTHTHTRVYHPCLVVSAAASVLQYPCCAVRVWADIYTHLHTHTRAFVGHSTAYGQRAWPMLRVTCMGCGLINAPCRHLKERTFRTSTLVTTHRYVTFQYAVHIYAHTYLYTVSLVCRMYSTLSQMLRL